ncbi:TIGR03757 family integrating conjugative element protein [Porticoccus sp. GXU_MW_L64]
MSPVQTILASLIAVFITAPICLANGLPLELKVITSDNYPVTGNTALSGSKADIAIYNLDNVDRLTESLGQNLPNTAAKSHAQLQKRIELMGQSTLEAQFRDAHQGLVTLITNRINRFPAIIVNDRAVIYGVTHIPEAIAIYRQWKHQQGAPK